MSNTSIKKFKTNVVECDSLLNKNHNIKLITEQTLTKKKTIIRSLFLFSKILFINKNSKILNFQKKYDIICIKFSFFKNKNPQLL